jgi:hypothetical protein
MMGHSTAQTSEHYLESPDPDKTLEIDNGLFNKSCQVSCQISYQVLARYWGILRNIDTQRQRDRW